ncbi:MAG: hypothetical protein ACFCGT_11605 [Sandaracinaceae bacterium]
MADPDRIPGEPPPVHDEAADTPLWLPVVGLVLLVVLVFGVVWQSVTAPSDEAGGGSGSAAVEGGGGEASADGDEAAAGAPAAGEVEAGEVDAP